MEGQVLQMRLPTFQYSRSPTQEQIVQFTGLDYRYGAQGAIEDGDGFSFDRAPSLSPRQGRSISSAPSANRMYLFDDNIVYLDGTTLYVKSSRSTVQVATGVSADKLRVLRINTKIVILPNMLYIDMTDGNLSVYRMDINSSCSYSMIRRNTYIADEGQFFDLIDTSLISLSPIRVNDTLTITIGSKTISATVRYYVGAAGGAVLGFDAGTIVQSLPASGSIRVKRTIPQLDCVCEFNNRLWGTEGNTIHVSALGDPLNWERFDGLADDSYAVAVASDGAFTGCAGYSSHVAFFKENTIHKLYGTQPSNYQLVTLAAPGVERGKDRTIAAVDGILYYKGAHGVYAYDGNVPSLASPQLSGRWENAYFACGTPDRYYIAADVGNGKELLYLDTRAGAWGIEHKNAVNEVLYDGQYRYDLSADGLLWRADGSKGELVDWWVQLADFDEGTNSRKRYQKLLVRTRRLSEDSELRIDIRTDYGKWREVYAEEGKRAEFMYVPIYPTRCRRLGIRFRCRGDVEIQSITRQYVAASERG